MFDLGFWELALIGLIGLLVLGPERLPAVARTLGTWTAKARRFMTEISTELQREADDGGTPPDKKDGP